MQPKSIPPAVPTLARELAHYRQLQDEAKAAKEHSRRLEIRDRQHAAREAEQDRRLYEMLGGASSSAQVLALEERIRDDQRFDQGGRR